MTNSNRIKLTWISFFSYALTGALVIVTGMVMGNIADYFHLPVSSMSNTFTFLNAGILISIFLNAWLMEIVPLKTQLRFGFILMVLAGAGLMLSHSLADVVHGDEASFSGLRAALQRAHALWQAGHCT